MLWAKRLLLLACFIAAASAQAIPPGVVEVYSAYTDIKTKQVQIIKGYGILIKLVLQQPQGDAVIYTVQTVSHLSQGGLRENQIPRLGVRLYAKDGTQIFAHYNEYDFPKELEPAVGSATKMPLLFSSYFANLRDLELIVLESTEVFKNIPEFVEIKSRNGVVTDYAVAVDPAAYDKPVDGWRMKRLRNTLGILCPVHFPSCLRDEPEVRISGEPNYFTRVVSNLGYVQTEYDWLFFTRTEQGMSGLPVLNYMKAHGNRENIKKFESGLYAGVHSLVSSSSRLSEETWGVIIDPTADFIRWYRARFDGGKHKLIGVQKAHWELENGMLRRTLFGEKHKYVEWSPDDQPGVEKLRCNNGSEFRKDNGNGFRFDNGNGFRMDNGNGFRFDNGNGFRMDNGNGFRFDNGDCISSTALGKGGFKVETAEGFRKSNLLLIEHADYTRIAPATVAGMALSHYVKDADGVRLKNGINAGLRFTEYLESNPKVEWAPFGQFFASMYDKEEASEEERQSLILKYPALKGMTLHKFSAELDVTRLSREENSEELHGSRGRVSLITAVTAENNFAGVWIQLDFSGRQIREWITFTPQAGLPKRLFAPYITLDGGSHLELAGLLTHNPDRVNLPDLTRMGPVIDGKVRLRKMDGDPFLRTVFTLQEARRTYYFSAPGKR